MTEQIVQAERQVTHGEGWVNKTIIEGIVLPTERADDIRVIDGRVRQDDTRLGKTWPDDPIILDTVAAVNGHLASYEGGWVRVTIERLG
jgi:hypothetical protein